MKKAIVILGTLLSAASHAATPAPVCENRRQCEAMWASAQDAIGLVTRMRNRIVTDGRIETFAAVSVSTLSGVVTKVPTGQDGYRIVANLSCYRYVPCDDLARQGIELFNSLVSSAGVAFGPTQSESTVTGSSPAPNSPTSVVPAAAAKSSGQYSYHVERMPETKACNREAIAVLSGKGPGVETYSVSCMNGDVLTVRCENSDCRVLK